MQNKNDEYQAKPEEEESRQGDLFEEELMIEMAKISNENEQKISVGKQKPKQQWGVAGVIIIACALLLFVSIPNSSDEGNTVNQAQPHFSEMFE